MKIFYSFIFLVSCSMETHERETKFSISVLSKSELINVENLNHLTIQANQPLSINYIKKNLTITEKCNDQDVKNKLNISVLNKSNNIFDITIKDMKVGVRYEVCFGANDFEKVHHFTAWLPLKLISHDLGKEPHIVDRRRLIFNFTFNRMINIDQSTHISIGNDTRAFKGSLTLSEDKKTITFRRNEKDMLEAGSSYSFRFFGVHDEFLYNNALEPISAIAASEISGFFSLGPLLINPSTESVEIELSLSQQHHSRLIFFKGDNKFCIKGRCEWLKESVEGKPLNHYTNFFVTGIEANNKIDFVIESEDRQGNVLKFQGSFATVGFSLFRISEVMINPQNSKDVEENKLEYIEIWNASDTDQSLKNLKVIIEEPLTHKKRICYLRGADSVKAKSFFLITAKDFRKDFYKLQNIPIVEAGQAKLCGGLSNLTKKIIKIYRDDREIDRYGGYKWQSPEGTSIERNVVEGLDEDSNYCYSKHPTPAQINTCE